MSIVKELKKKLIPKAVGKGLSLMALVAPKLAAEKALDIFCTPRGGRVRSYQEKFFKIFNQKVVKSGEFDVMTYHQKGDGPKILLCHGWESNSFRWRKLYKYLSEANYDIIMMDGPAHGQTGSDKFTALLYGEMMTAVIKDYQPAIIIGHSVGAMATVMSLYLSGPQTINKVVLLAPPDRMTDITKNYFDLIGGSKRLRRYYAELVIERFGNPMSFYSAADFSTHLNQDCLIIHDERDMINRYEEGLRIHKSWKESKLITTQGQGHSLQSKDVYEAILNFTDS